MFPKDGVTPVIVGDAPTVTLKTGPVLATPPTVTTTFPVVAPNGTCTTMHVGFHNEGDAKVPLNVTEFPLPSPEPKFVPEMITVVFTGPEY